MIARILNVLTLKAAVVWLLGYKVVRHLKQL